eukprot:scaffold439_cov415-Prasinococcus_capsulatus_cf.AAC.34
MSINSIYLVILDNFQNYVDDDHIPGYMFQEGEKLGDFTLYHIYTDLPNTANGDGLSLDINGIAQDFLGSTFISWGGQLQQGENLSFQLPADVAESMSTPTGSSVGLSGSGYSFGDFTFVTFDQSTPGQLNQGMLLSCQGLTQCEGAGSGDFNSDGQINVLDVVSGVNVILKVEVGPCFDSVGDINSDGVFNVLDIVAMVNVILAG